MKKLINLIVFLICALSGMEMYAGTAPSKVVKTSRSNNPRNAHHVVSGNGFTIEMRNNQLWAWGRNDFGQLGQGTISGTPTTSPVQIGTADDWADFSVGFDHVIAIKTNGKLYAWGRNNFGQLGNGTLTTLSSPTQIGAAQDWVAIGIGANHSFGIKANGTLWAWGNNLSGQLGKGTNTNTISERSPVQIGIASDWASVTGGLLNTVATKANGTLWTWGDNTFGQLANGTNTITIADRAPVQVALALNTWISVECGENYVMGLTSNGGLYGWGQNNFGQLGDNTIVNKNLPTVIGAAFSWTGVSCSQSGAIGNAHTLAVQANGTVWSWGDNTVGQLGNGTTNIIPTLIPTQITGLSNIVNVEGGWQCSFARRADAQVFAWGINASGNLGTGTLINLTSPTAISIAPVGWSNLSLGDLFSAAVKSNGTLWTWGDNTRGQLGTGSLAPTSSNIAVQAGAASNWVTVSAGKNHALGIQADGTLWAWGDNNFGQLGNGTVSVSPFPSPALIAVAGPWVSVAAGDNYSFAIKADGTMWAWGRNSNGQLGDGTTIDKATPVQIGIQTNWLYIECGSNSTIALKANGTLFSWGANGAGQLGLGNLTQFLLPQQVGILSDWISIANGKGGTHALGVRANGNLYSWGNNTFGQLGNGTNNIVVADRSPVQVGTSDKWVLVSAGQNHSFGQKVDGTGWIWGDNTSGQLGTGTFGNTPPINIPTQLIIPSNTDSILTIHCGYNHSGIIKSTRAIICLSGANLQGQLGDGNNIDRNEFHCGVYAATVPKSIINPIFSTQQFGAVATGSINNKIMRVTIPVDGTIGTLTLNSLIVNYTGTNASDITVSGVKLWMGSANALITQIGSAQTLGGGIATFSGLSEVLNSGPNYFWITLNISGTATFANAVDVKVNSGNINISASSGAVTPGSQPVSNNDPAGSRPVDYCNIASTVASTFINLISTSGLITNINNATLYSPNGYGSYTGIVGAQVQGGNVSITVSLNGGPAGVAIWVDWNEDGDFNDIGEDAFTTASFVIASITANFTVPISASLGNKRMRVVIENGNLTPAACSFLGTSGEAEDYTLNVITVPSCSAVLGSFAGSYTTTKDLPIICTGQTVNFDITPVTPIASGITYRLQYATTIAGIYSTIQGPNTGSSFSVISPVAGFYRIQVICTGSPIISSWIPVEVIITNPIITVNNASICSGSPIAVLSVISPQPNFDYTWSPANDLFVDAALTIPYVLNTPLTTVYAIPSATTIYNISGLNTITGCIGTTTSTVTVCSAITDEICQADVVASIPVTTSATFIQYNFVGATPSISASCDPIARDIWYRATVPAEGEIDVVTMAGNNAVASLNVVSSVVSIYTATNCTTAVALAHCNSNGAAGNMSFAHASNLTPGSTVYIRLASTVANNPVSAQYIRMAVTRGLVWTGAANDDFNNPANWHGGDATAVTLPDASISAIVPSGNPVKPKLYANTTTRGMYFLTGPPYFTSTGINLNSFTLNVKYDWCVGSAATYANSSMVLDCNGKVGFSGTLVITQMINGKTTFGNIEFNNPATTVQFNNPCAALCIVKATSGNVNANGNLTLKSSASQTALVDATGAGIINGNVSVERKIGPTSGYHYLSSAVDNAFVNNTINGWRDDFTINAALDGQVFIPGGTYSALATVWEYDETNPNPNPDFGWVGATGATDAISPLKGFACVIPGYVTVDVLGPLNNDIIPGGYTITRASDGTNLVGNPYASPISWNAFRGLASNSAALSASGYKTFITTGGYSGSYGTWNGTIGSPIIVNDKIASSQSFMVECLLPVANINANNTIRLATQADLSANFFSGYNSVPDLIRMEVQGNGHASEMVVYFDPSSLDTYNNNCDASALFAPVTGVPTIYTRVENNNLSINVMGALNLDKVVPLGVKIQTAGTYNLVATDMTSFAPSVIAYLEDTKAGTMTNLRTNPNYPVTLPAGEVNNRFFMHFHPAVELNALNETCAGNDGKLIINYPTTNTVDMVIKDENGNVISMQNNLTGTVTINNLAAGNYVAEMVFGVAPNTYTTSDYFTIAEGNAVYANLSASATAVDMNANTTVNFTATSQGSTNFNWNFGDGTIITNGAANVSHTYAQVGTYTVTFEASNGICNAVANTTVEVTNTTGLTAISNSNLQVAGVGSKVTVRFGNKMEGTGNIEVINMLGEVVAHLDNVSMKGTKEIELSNIATGQYLVKISNNNQLFTEKVFLSRQ